MSGIASSIVTAVPFNTLNIALSGNEPTCLVKKSVNTVIAKLESQSPVSPVWNLPVDVAVELSKNMLELKDACISGMLSSILYLVQSCVA